MATPHPPGGVPYLHTAHLSINFAEFSEAPPMFPPPVIVIGGSSSKLIAGCLASSTSLPCELLHLLHLTVEMRRAIEKIEYTGREAHCWRDRCSLLHWWLFRLLIRLVLLIRMCWCQVGILGNADAMSGCVCHVGHCGAICVSLLPLLLGCPSLVHTAMWQLFCERCDNCDCHMIILLTR